jgi:hypothetical protein
MNQADDKKNSIWFATGGRIEVFAISVRRVPRLAGHNGDVPA